MPPETRCFIRYARAASRRSASIVSSDGALSTVPFRSMYRRLFKYAFRPGTVPVRELADHTPVNYLSAVMGLRP
jgi:hypothetical protein